MAALDPDSPPRGPSESQHASKLRKTARLMPTFIRREARKRSSTTPFLIWISFLLSFVGARLWVVTFRSVGRGDTSGINFEIGRNVILGGYHIHHIATGIVLVAIAGWLGLHYKGKIASRTAAVFYGIGLGFIVDELGFVIGGITPYKGDVQVFYVAVALAALLMSAVYVPRFWRSFRQDLRQLMRLVAGLPALENRSRDIPKGELDREVEAALGPPVADDIERTEPVQEPVQEPPAAPGINDRPTAEPLQAHTAELPANPLRVPTALPSPTAQTDQQRPYRVLQSERSHVFESLIGKLVEVLVILILVGLLLGLAKLVFSLWDVVWGVSVTRLFQPILIGVLTLLVGVELMRAMVEYLRHSRLMLPFLVDAGILLGLREIADELFQRDPDPVLTAVLGGLLVALGGLRVILTKSMAHARKEQGPV